MAENGKYVVGFDLGGTKMICGVFDTDLGKLSSRRSRTNAAEGAKAVIAKMISLIEAAVADAGVSMNDIGSIGVAVPGPVNPEEGIVHQTPNLPFENLPLSGEISEKLGVPVLLENDVNAGTYGEFIRGAGRGYRNVIGIFPGTGIGGGLILNGELFRGSTGSAGEVGHMIIQLDGPLCGCGQYGCLEALASRTAMAKDAVALASSGALPKVVAVAGTDITNYKSKVFAKNYENGEPALDRIVERAARYLGIGIANCVNLLNPQVVILGGGLVERLGDRYVKVAEESMRRHAMQGIVKDVVVREAELGDDSVPVGAAGLALAWAEGEPVDDGT